MQEVEYRVERSFTDEDVFERVLGGPEMRHKAQLMVTAFVAAGSQQSHALGHPERSTAEWMQDPESYRAAVRGVFRALVASAPGAWKDPEANHAEIEGYKGIILTAMVNTGRRPAKEERKPS